MQCFLDLKKLGGHFDPLGLVSGDNFQYWGSFFIVVTSDVNKNAIFLGVPQRSQWSMV